MYEASGGKPNERPKLGRRRLTLVCDGCSTKQRADVEFAQANPNCPVCHRRRRWEWF
jgi:hypothetical protein